MKTNRLPSRLALGLSLALALGFLFLPGEAVSSTQSRPIPRSPAPYTEPLTPTGFEVEHDAAFTTTAIGGIAYVTLSGSDRVALVDTASHFVGTVDVGAAGCDFPWRATMSPDGSYVYVGCYYSGNVVVIETAGNTVVTTVGGIPSADGIAFTRDGAYALVGSRRDHQIVIINTSTHFISFLYTPDEPRSVVAHPYLDRAYATCADGTILVIDTTTFSISTAIPVGGDPWDVAISPDGQWAFAGDRQGSGLAVIETGTNTVFTTVTGLGNLTGLEVAPDGSEVYACGLGSGVHVIDGTTFAHITTIPGLGNAWEAAVTCDGSELYVGNAGDQVPVVDTATHSVTDQIAMPGSGTRGIAICPQYVATGVILSPPAQTNQGARGQMVAHQETLVNATGASDSFSLTLGSHAWDTALSTDSLGPIANGDTAAFTVYVTVPLGVDWYLSDMVVVSATSVASPTVYSDTADFTTQAYAPPEIDVSPDVLTSTQYVNETVDETLTISNGNGVTLTFDLAGAGVTDPALLFHLDEPPGATTFSDASENDNHGSCLGTSCPTAGVDGRFGKAASFDGSNDYVEVGAPVPLALQIQNEIALEAWIYVTDYPASHTLGTIVGCQYDYGSNGYAIHLDGRTNPDGQSAPPGHISFQIGDGNWHVTNVNAQVPLNQWVHVVAVRKANEDAKVYYNGVQQPSTSVPWNGSITYSGAELDLGRQSDFGDRFFSGVIDEVAIYDRALSSEEVEALYLHGLGGEDVPWLSTDPISGTVTTSSSVPIQATFDATGLQPDTYTTQVVVRSNDPVTPLVSVPVTMTVEPTANMGWVEGIVTDARTGDLLEATIIALGQPYTVTADPDTGSYTFWLDEGSHTLQVTAEGYVTQKAVLDIVAQQGITRDFTLEHYQLFLPLIMKNRD